MDSGNNIFQTVEGSRSTRVKWFNTFLKKDRFLPETGKPLLSSYLHKLGAVFAVISNDTKNLLEAMTIASQAFRHSQDNHIFLAQNYNIVNFQKKRGSGCPTYRAPPAESAAVTKLE